MIIDNAALLNASILIVDDQQSNIRVLEQMLQEDGYTRVSSTTNAQQVCALHREHDYDLILLDLLMPGMDGFEVLAALRANAAESYVPVIVLTAHPGHKLSALQSGARDFISKPFDLVEVKTRIRNMLEVRLLYKQLENYNRVLEQTVQERTAELRESEARYRSLTELASDWYWEQNKAGEFTKVSGPVPEVFGIQRSNSSGTQSEATKGWDEAARAELLARIAARQPFLDFALNRVNTDGSQQLYQVSGEPMFDRFCGYIGFRGIGVERTAKK